MKNFIMNQLETKPFGGIVGITINEQKESFNPIIDGEVRLYKVLEKD